jgi:hypothetical protein
MALFLRDADLNTGFKNTTVVDQHRHVLYCAYWLLFRDICIIFYRFRAFKLSSPPSNSDTSYSLGYLSMISLSFADCSRCSSVSSS